MDHKKQRNIDPWDDGVYGTGNTMPPKGDGWLVALLLMLVIFLSGIISVLGFLNVRLFQQLNQQTRETVSISLENQQEPMSSQENSVSNHAVDGFAGSRIPGQIKPTLGLQGEAITQFDQAYFHIPAGLYLTAVTPGSSAANQGVEPGDILISLDGDPVLSQLGLDTILSAHAPGDTLEALVYRDGGEYTLTLTIQESRE